MPFNVRFTPYTISWAASLYIFGLWAGTVGERVTSWGHGVAVTLSYLCWVLAFLSIITYKGATPYQWLTRFIKSHRGIGLAWVTSSRSRGKVWDGKSISTVIEIFEDPWEISTVESNGNITSRKIPLDEIRVQLRQFDITLNHIRIVEYGYKTATFDKASLSLNGITGAVGALLGGRTFVEVSVSLMDNIPAAAARKKIGETTADGLIRVVDIATDRVLRVFQQNDIPAKIISSNTLNAIQKEILRGVGRAAGMHHWSMAGSPTDPSKGSAITFIPAAGSWNVDAQQVWNEVVVQRQYNCMTIKPHGLQDKVMYATTYLTDDPGALSLLTSQGLLRENGRHTARLSNILPAAVDLNMDASGERTISVEDSVGLELSTHPLGVFLGLTDPGRERVFMHVARGGEPLWIIGGDEYARRFVLRLSTQRHRVAVAVDTPEWDALIASRRSRLLAKTSNPFKAMASSDVIVCTADQLASLEVSESSPAIVVVSDTPPPITPDACIEVDQYANTITVTSHGKTANISNDKPPTERQWID